MLQGLPTDLATAGKALGMQAVDEDWPKSRTSKQMDHIEI